VTITGVLPASGSVQGATGVTITGTNFAAPIFVTIGGVARTDLANDRGATAHPIPALLGGLLILTVDQHA